MEVVKNLITSLAETEMYLLDTEMKKIRRVIVTGDGFEVKKGIFRDRVIGLKLKLSGYNTEGKLFPIDPVTLREFDQINLNLYSPYNPEPKK